MNIKIYFNDKPLFLTDTVDEEIAPYVHHDDAVFIDELSSPGINSMIHEMRLPKIHAGIYYHPNLEELKKAFFRKFVLIHAGGGLVINEQGKILMIFRRGKWDLPKGKLDPGETLEACANREVKEETGLKELKQLGGLLLTTYHTYDENGKHLLKDTHWYQFKAPGKQLLTPQGEEEITRIEWADKAEAKKYADQTYPLIRDVLTAGGVT